MTVFIDGRNNDVAAGNDIATASEDGTTTIAAADLLANDRDYDGDTLAITSVPQTSASGATVSIFDGNVV